MYTGSSQAPNRFLCGFIAAGIAGLAVYGKPNLHPTGDVGLIGQSKYERSHLDERKK